MKAQFTLRDVLWLSVMVSLAVGWSLERSALQKQIKDLELRIQDVIAVGRH